MIIRDEIGNRIVFKGCRQAHGLIAAAAGAAGNQSEGNR